MVTRLLVCTSHVRPGGAVIAPRADDLSRVSRRQLLLFGAALGLSGCTGRISKTGLAATPLVPSLNVNDFGALGDGSSDDTSAIQSALSAVGPAGGRVIFPPGVFRVSRSGPDHFLEFKPNTHLIGAGMDVSILKPVDHAGAWRDFLRPVRDGDPRRLDVQDIGFHMNTRTNPVTGDPVTAGMPRFAIQCAKNAKVSIAIARCRFHDCSNVNTLFLAGKRISVLDCEFTATGAQSESFWDHSSIYAVASEGGSIRIENNTFTGTLGSGASRTAIETHGGTQIVKGNRISAYLNGMNITGIAATVTDRVEVSGNQIGAVMIGMQLWCRQLKAQPSGTDVLRRVKIRNNTTVIDSDAWRLTPASSGSFACGVLFNVGATTPVDDVLIESNSIAYLSSRATPKQNEYMAAGITLSGRGEVRNLSIISNQISKSLSAGILLNSIVRNVTVSKNHFVNPASGARAAIADAYRSMVTLGGTVESISIADNKVTDNRTPQIIKQTVGSVAPIRLLGKSLIDGNQVVPNTSQDIPEVSASVTQ